MSNNVLEIAEGIQYQTADEELAYSITTTNWVSSPTSPTVKVYDESVDEDVTSTVMTGGDPGAPAGDVITLSLLKDLTVDHSYRIEVQFTVGSNVYECFFRVRCVR